MASDCSLFSTVILPDRPPVGQGIRSNGKLETRNGKHA